MKKILFLILLQSAIVNSASNYNQVLEQGIEAYNSGNFGSAELLFRKGMDSDDDETRDRSWYYLARSIFNQKKYKSSIFEFNSFLNKCRSSQLCIESRYWMGESYFYLNDYFKSIEEYKRYISQSKDGIYISSAHEKIGLIYFSQGRFDEAVIELEAAISSTNDKERNALLVLKIGEAHYKNKNHDETLKRLNPLLTSKLDPKVISKARLIIGQIYQDTANPAKALLILGSIPDNLMKEAPFYNAYYFRARAMIETGNISGAKSMLEIFVIIGRESEWYYEGLFELGRIVSDSKEEKKGLEYLETVRKSSSSRDLKLKAAKFISKRYINQKPELAIPYLEDAVNSEIPEDRKEALLLLGRVYISTGRLADAEKTLNLFIDKYPFDSNLDEIYFLRGRILIENRKIKEAVDMFTRIQKENPFSKYVNESNYYLALANFRDGNYKDAINLSLKYLGLQKIENSYEAHLILLDSYIRLNDSKNATIYADLIIKKYINIRGVEAAVYRFAQFLNGKDKRADYYRSIVTSRFPESESAMAIFLAAANRSFESGDFKTASDFYTKYISGPVSRDRGLAYYNRLVALYEIKKYQEIIAIIRRGSYPAMDESQFVELPFIMMRSYFALGQYDKAYSLAVNEDKKKMSQADLLLFIKSSLKVGDLYSAKNASEEITEDESMLEFLYEIGTYYKSKKKYEEASEQFAKILSSGKNLKMVNQARLELAEIAIGENNIESAISNLNEIKNGAYSNRKNFLMISAYFKTREYKNAKVILEKNYDSLSRSEYGEPAVRLALEFYYQKKDLAEFLVYSAMLSRFRGNSAYIDYLSGMLYFDLNMFDKAYFHFYSLSQVESKYKDESLFYLAEIYLQIYANKNAALMSYQKIMASKTAGKNMIYRSMLMAAVISRDINRNDLVKSYLENIIKDDTSGLFSSQAQNLYEVYGFKKR